MLPSTRRVVRAGVAAASAAAFAAAAAPAAHAVDPAFYMPPASLPANNGDLIKSQSLKLGVTIGIPGLGSQFPGRAQIIQYRSTDATGAPVAVTGTYIEPNNPWKGGGPRPLVSYSEGTQGQGDACTPSKTLESTVNISGGALGIGYEVPSIYGLLDKGIAVVITDYIGFGDPTRVHTYVDRKDMGHAVLDAARAALDVPGASVTASSPVGVYGYSQGGGAAAAAAELQTTYAPDVNLKAGYAGAPPANLAEVMKTADGTTLTGVLGYAINGLVRNNPSLQGTLDANTNNAGKAALKKASTQCIGESAASFAYKKTTEWTTSRKSLATVVNSIPSALAIVNEQRIGKIKPGVPMRITVGTKDDIVGYPQARQLAVDWCRLGATVNWVPLNQTFSSLGTSLNHLGPMLTHSGLAQNWLADRLAGKPASANCSAVGVS